MGLSEQLLVCQSHQESGKAIFGLSEPSLVCQSRRGSVSCFVQVVCGVYKSWLACTSRRWCVQVVGGM